MDNIIKISNLNFKYNDHVIFDNFNLNIKRGSFTSIIGPNGSGKSTLMKIITGLVKSDAEIIIDDITMSLSTYKDIRKIIGMIFENPDNQFVAETVMDEIAFTLENLNMPKKEIKASIKEISEMLGIADILEKDPHTLSGSQKELVALASALISKPKIVILDETLESLDIKERDLILKILVDLNKTNQTTIINITHNSEELLYGTDIVIINKGKIIENGLTKDVLANEKAFKNNGLELPFIIDLSSKLKYYGLVEDLVLDIDELVDTIWK